MTIEQVMEDYELTREDVLAALSYAAHAMGREQIRAVKWPKGVDDGHN